MQIKEIASKLKITPRAIRFYEEKGLIHPVKNEQNQYRTFTEQDVWRLQTIISLREVGMAIDDIKEALAQIDQGDEDSILYYLELQRSVLFSRWLELKQIIKTTDDMIESVKQKQSLPLDDIYQLAEGSKRLKVLRQNWQDIWNYDQLAKNHDQRVVSGLPRYKDYAKALDLTVQWVSPVEGETGLDIGTGTGNLAGKFLEKGIHMAGIDQSKEMLKQCQSKFPTMRAKLGNFLAIPFLDQQFDFVVSSFAFHHLTDQQKGLALEEMRRVLKPHGRICIVDLMTTKAHVRTETPAPVTESYTYLPDLVQWFESNGYISKHHQINELLHIVYAVPIR